MQQMKRGCCCLPPSPLLPGRLLDSFPAHTALLGDNGRIVLVNRAWRQFGAANGLTHPCACVGASYLEVCDRGARSDATARAAGDGLRETLAGGADLTLDYPCHSPTEESWFTLRATRFVLEGRPWLVAAHYDVTALERATRAEEEFVATVSHELRTPLTAILASLAMASAGRNGPLSPATSKFLDIAGRNARRLLALVNDLLDTQRLALAGGPTLERRAIDLGLLLETAAEANRSYAVSLGVTLRLEVPPDRPVPLRADPDRLMQVLGNLISNAAKHSPAGATVEITLEAEPASALVSVRDHGPGVPEALRSRLFERFARGGSSEPQRGESTGLGLSIAKAIVEAHGGTIGFDSPAPGGGSRFWFRLPLGP